MDQYNDLLKAVGKVIQSVTLMPGWDAYYRVFRVEFTDGSVLDLKSVDHADGDGMGIEWVKLIQAGEQHET